MNSSLKTYLVWPLILVLALGVGLYPLAYVWGDMSGGLLSSKSASLLQNSFWNLGFYLHIFLGGLALLIGWSQFVKKLRPIPSNKLGIKYRRIHRTVGYVYAVSVLLSGVAGLYISYYATGPWHTKLGFFLLAVMWLWTTTMAIKAIRNKKITNHQYWMMRSYALTFAGVTLRLWMPFFGAVLGWSFLDGYKVVAWLCWLPNLLLMEWYICKKINAKTGSMNYE
jgi:uncharacterized membrane protein